MKLYGSYTSPYVRHCRVALGQSGFDYEFIETDYVMSAKDSPTAKVPFFVDGDIKLTDSSSILKYVREKAGGDYLQDIEEFENSTLVTTMLDTTINLFLLELDGFGPAEIKYLSRQKNRVDSGLKEINRRFDPNQSIELDSVLRCACFIDWALFRKRISIDGLNNIQGLLNNANQLEVFSSTAPPG